jgi:hypothetical protein
LSKFRPSDTNIQKEDLLIAEQLTSIQQTSYANNISSCSSFESTRPPQIAGASELIWANKQLASRACGFDNLSMFSKTVLVRILSVNVYFYYNIYQHFIHCLRLVSATLTYVAETQHAELTEVKLLSYTAYKSSVYHCYYRK